MDEKQMRSISKFLSLILRHSPETAGIQLDEQGWVAVDELLEKLAVRQHQLSRTMLEYIVATNDKKRFAFNEDHTRIRASQGHSVNIELALGAQEPPQYLYHGTVANFLEAIQLEGLQKMSRQQVHLSKDRETAEKVGSRRGKPVILSVSAGQMHREGFSFYCSDNGVWLTDHVPPAYINFK